jgi:hypothetical protein
MEATVVDYAEANIVALAKLQAALEQYGILTIQVDDVLRYELKFGNETYGYAYFVSAPFVFTLPEHPREDVEWSERARREDVFFALFRKLQGRLMGEAFQAKKELHLFVVGEQAYLDTLTPQELAMVSQNVEYSRKYVGTTEQIADWFTPLFPSVRGASEIPVFELMREPRDTPKRAPAVTHTLLLRDVLNEPDAGAMTTDAYAPVRKRIERIFTRILGNDYRIFWNPEGIGIGRFWHPEGLPWFAVSKGEQQIFNFARFLAELADEASPVMRIGIYGALNGLSALPYLSAMYVLREFTDRTGAAIRLQVPQGDCCDRAEWILKRVTTVRQFERVFSS